MSGWWRPWRTGLAVLVAVGVAALAFVFRFNTLGGSLGGFDNDHYVHLLRSDMLLRGEQPLRDFAEAELRGAWPSLGYAASAWAQQVWEPTLLAEAYLTVGGLALAAAIGFVLALDLSKRWLVALLACACIVAAGPKLYNYEKVVMLAGGAGLIRLWLLQPSAARLIGLALWTAIATLFRHDFGIYVAIAAIVALGARRPAGWTAVARRVALYVGVTTLLLLPSIVWVQVYKGVVPYVQSTIESVRGESARTDLPWPNVDMAAGLSDGNLIALTYYAFWLVPIIAILAWIWKASSRERREPLDLATGLTFIVLALVVNMAFLRGSLLSRFGDAIVPVALAGAWATTAAPAVWQVRHLAPGLLWALPRAVMLFLLASLFVVEESRREMEVGGLTEGREMVSRRFRAARTELSGLPPVDWSGITPEGTLVAARYVAECTSSDDHVMIATYAPEIPVFARRRFAGGQGTFGLNFYTAEEPQRAAVARLRAQSVPIVIASFDEFEGEFVDDYPIVAAYLAERYRDAGAIDVDGEPRFRVFVDATRPPRRTDATLGLPCYR